MSLLHFVRWRRLHAEVSGSMRGKNTGCSSKEIARETVKKKPGGGCWAGVGTYVSNLCVNVCVKPMCQRVCQTYVPTCASTCGQLVGLPVVIL